MNISESESQSESESESQSPLSCGLTRFLHPRCFFVSAVFSNLSPFILNMCPNLCNRSLDGETLKFQNGGRPLDAAQIWLHVVPFDVHFHYFHNPFNRIA